jgi:hypothetical protein
MSADRRTDELLDALDQFTNALYWLRARIPYTAEVALTEALADSVSDPGAVVPSDNANLHGALAALLTASRGESVAADLAEALNAWSAALSTEHHRSAPFQAVARHDRGHR